MRRNSVGVSSALSPSTYAWTLSRVEPQLLDQDLVAASRLRFAHAAACSRAYARGELLHRERLHEVVVGADLERVHAVVLRAARATRR